MSVCSLGGGGSVLIEWFQLYYAKRQSRDFITQLNPMFLFFLSYLKNKHLSASPIFKLLSSHNLSSMVLYQNAKTLKKYYI